MSKNLVAMTPSWESLSKIQNTWHVKTTYVWLFIVPIAAKFLSQLDDNVTLTIFQHQFNVLLNLPFSWKMFYFGALCFSLSNVMYLARCYPIVKENRSYFDFEKNGKGKLQIVQYAKQIGMELGSEVCASSTDQLKNSDLKDVFWEVFQEASIRRKPERVVCGILCTLGYVSIFIVLVENLYEVLTLTS